MLTSFVIGNTGLVFSQENYYSYSNSDTDESNVSDSSSPNKTSEGSPQNTLDGTKVPKNDESSVGFSEISNSCSIKKFANTTAIPETLTIDTEKTRYTPGQFVRIFTFVFDKQGCPADAFVNIKVSEIYGEKNVIIDKSFHTSGIYDDNFGAIFEKRGDYRIQGTLVGTNIDNTSPLIKSETTVNITEFFETRPFYIMLIAFLSFIGLILSITLLSSTIATEVLRFVFITGMVMPILFGFAFVDQPFGSGAPVGLVQKGIPGGSVKHDGGEWMFNIGGDFRSGYATGIQIPLYVIIFGMIGGYLRFLYETSNRIKKIRDEFENGKTETIKTRLNKITFHKKSHVQSFYQSLEDLSLLFLAPVLAVAMYFLVTIIGLGNYNAVYTISVISLAVGLITDEVIRALIKFANSRLGIKPEPDGEVKPEPDGEVKPEPDGRKKSKKSP